MKNILFCFFLVISFGIKAQDCNLTNHSVNINDSWESCETASNPNPIRNNSHWVKYDLGYVYSLGASHFWNYNVEGETDKGMKNISIDISLNGSDWTEVASFQLSEASGTTDYEGEEGPHFNELDARYILITAIDTWGDSCAGLSEVKFDIEGTVSVSDIEKVNHSISLFPNPAMQSISIESDFDLREIIIINATGQELNRMPYTSWVDISYLPAGIYFLKSVSHSNETRTTKFIKQK